VTAVAIPPGVRAVDGFEEPGSPIDPATFPLDLDQLRARAGVRQKVQWLTSDRLAAPALAGRAGATPQFTSAVFSVPSVSDCMSSGS